MTTASYRSFTGSAAQNYERFFVPAIATPVADILLAVCGLRAGARLLDVACGTGVVARRAAPELGPEGSVTAADVADDMISTARNLPVPDGAPIDWEVADATDLPFDDADFDIVTCQMGLMFMEDRPAAVAEMARVLSPGGRLVVATPGSVQPVFEVMHAALADHIDPGLAGFVGAVFSMDDPGELAALLGDAGLDDVSVRIEHATLRLPAPRELLWEYVNLTPMGPFVADAPETARAALEDAMAAGCKPHTVDGLTPVEQPIVLATATR